MTELTARHQKLTRRVLRAALAARWFSVLVLVLLFLPPQIRRFTVGDLTPVPQPQVADEVNGWVALQPLLAKIVGDPPKGSYAPAGDGRMPAATRAWVAQNAALLPEIDTALARTAWSWPRPADITSRMPDLAPYRKLVRLVCAAAMIDAEDGRGGVAVERLTRLVRANDKLLGCEASVIQYLVAVACQSITVKAIQQTIAARPVAADWPRWQQLSYALGAEPDPGQALGGALRGEFQMTRAFLLREAVHEEEDADQAMPAWMLPCWLWDPWRTLADLRTGLDLMAAEASRPRSERQLGGLEAFVGEPPVVCEYNQAGKILTRLLFPSLAKVVDKSDHLAARRRLTLTMLALRRSADLHGKLPASLGTLVEDGLLEAVPVDPFDGQPLRYDPARKLLWSVSRNERDDHGSMVKGDDKWAADEVVALEFATP